MRDSVEIDEMKYPMLVTEQRIIADSEGAGRFRGSPGAYVEYGPVGDEPMEVVYLSDGTLNPARGVRGGHDGAPPSSESDFATEPSPTSSAPTRESCCEPGETIISVSCGGGGYGPPGERDPVLVANDVREGWITPARARDIYRVAIAEDGTVDRQATERLRT